MATQKFLTRNAGKTKQSTALTTSTGMADAGRVVATGSDGRLDESVMPLGIGASTTIGVASEDLSAGKFVNFWNDAGTLKVRLADNSNGRPADGYVTTPYTTDEAATVYPLDGVNSDLSGLTVGADYWLGTAGGVTAVPLDSTDDANANKIDQLLGKAKSVTELITTDDHYITL